MAHAALIDARTKTRLAELATGALWVVGTAAVLRIVAGLFSEVPLAAALFGAIVADLAARRAGVSWDEPSAVAAPAQGSSTAARANKARVASGPSWRGRAARVGIGAAVAVATLIAAVALGAALGWVSIHVGQPATALVPASVRISAMAVRDELALRGLLLAACSRAGVPIHVAVLFAGASSGAALALEDGSSLAAVSLAIACGCAFASLWRTLGGWAAIGAHAGWSLTASALLRGALLDVEWSHGRLVPGPRAYGGAAWIGAACASIAAVLVLAMARRRAARIR